MVAPVTATASSELPAPGFEIENTIDRSGLSFGYDSGVTDFDTYLASELTHTSNGNEWVSGNFEENCVAGLIVTYGFNALGSGLITISR